MSSRVPVIHELLEAKHDSMEGREESSKNINTGVPFVRPKLTRKGSETEQRLTAMRERFTMLQMMEELEGDKEDKSSSGTPNTHTPTLAPQKSGVSNVDASPHPLTTTASQRWTKLRKVVNWPNQPAPEQSASRRGSFGVASQPSTSPNVSPRQSPRQTSPRQKRKILKRPSEQDLQRKTEEAAAASIELEDITLSQLWANADLPDVPEPTESLPSLALTSDVDAIKTELHTRTFQDQTKPLAVTVSRIPEEVVAQRKEAIEKAAAEERLIMLDKLRKREADIDSRETTAKDELRTKEAEARQRLDAEKQKVAALALRKQKNLAQDYRKMREQLEVGIKGQQGAIKEHFGKLLVHEETLARRFHAASNMAPQPIEFRIHLLRAVKNKLPKGCYVFMLTQYDGVGGRPLSWSRIGVNGIGSLRPGITRMCKHEGRYFDRILRVEDSCFALCPPRPLLKPNFVFVLELFQLASKHNPCDKIEAWTAVPMTYESMSIIEGKIKLPLLRGEPSPAVQHFKTMERMMSSDLHNWLCNIYIEVRHMSMGELGASADVLKSTEFDMDYFNKSFVPLDVDGKPILSRAQQEQRELEQELQAAGFGATGSTKAVKLQTEDSPDFEVPKLTVDKGIFRRKMPVNPAPNADEEGAGAGAEGGANAAAQQDEETAFGNQSPGTGKGKSSRRHFFAKSATLSGVKEGSEHSLLSYVGLGSKANLSDPNTPLLLKNDDNFLEHRKLLVQRWKDTIHEKYPPSPHASFHEQQRSQEEVLERGYNIQDEVFLHREQRGKLAGVEAISSKDARQWASAGLEGKIVRRWQAEGPRFDSEAITDPNASPHHHATSGLAHSPDREAKTWEELRDVREMEDYTMAICADPSRKKGVVPGAKSASKLRYISQELFGDFSHYLWGTFEFYLAIGVYLFALWIRIYVHYLAQYLYLQSLDTPVYGFRLMVFQIVQKYMSESISVAAEVGVVAIGPIANLCVYICLVVFGVLFHRVADYLPEVLSKFFAAFGLAAILDPLLVIVIDLIYHNYNCESSSDACAADYTSTSCNCFNGDFLKLWYRMEREEGSGLTGLFIMLLVYMGTGIIACLLMYQYIVYVHRDGRILDQWRRINGTVDEFFIPLDFEVSDEELKAIVHKALHWRGPKGSRRRLEVQTHTETDPADPYYLEQYKKFVIYEIDGPHKSVFREFHLEPNGAILEIFEARGGQSRSIFSNEAQADGSGRDNMRDNLQTRSGDHVDQTDREGGSKEDEMSQHSGDGGRHSEGEESPRRNDSLYTEKSPLLASPLKSSMKHTSSQGSNKQSGAHASAGVSVGAAGKARSNRNLSVRVDTGYNEPDLRAGSGNDSVTFF